MAVVLDLPVSEVVRRGEDAKAAGRRRGWLRTCLGWGRTGRRAVPAVPRFVASIQVTSTGGAVATWSEWLPRGARPGYCVNLLTFGSADEALEWVHGCAQGREFTWSQRLVEQHTTELNKEDIGWFLRRRRVKARA